MPHDAQFPGEGRGPALNAPKAGLRPTGPPQSTTLRGAPSPANNELAVSSHQRVNLAALTGARGLAAWFVVLYHIRPGLSATASPALMTGLSKGYLAVDFFFMLSGFVLWLTYGERLRAEGLREVPRFLGRRIARIWPLHIVILGVAAALALTFDLTGRHSGHYPWGQLPLHVLLVQNWGFTDALSWNDPAWSISCEWAAYLLFPLLALGANWRRASSTTLILTIVILTLLLHTLMSRGGAATLGVDIPRFGLPRALVEFTMGTLVCTLWQRWRTRPAMPTSAAIVAAVLLALTVTKNLPETFALPLFFAALLLALSLTAAHPANPLASRALVYLGEISYATYLVHFVGYVVFKLLFVADPFAVPLPALAAFLALTLIASAALHRWVELPAQTALRRLFESPKERSPAPAL